MRQAVTSWHAARFVAEWLRELTAGRDMLSLVDEARIMTRPDDEDDDEAGQERYDAIATEILTRTCEAVVPVLRETFLRIAREVLARERAASG